MKPPVETFQNGKDSWRRERYGWLLRRRGIIIIGCLTLVSAIFARVAIPFAPTFLNLEKDTIVIGVILVGGTLFMHFLIYLRKRCVRSLEIKYILHRLAHLIRDEQTQLYLLQSKEHSKQDFGSQLQGFLIKFCNLSKEYFTLLTNESCDIVIRLAALNENKNIVYRTYARSNGLSEARSNQSEDISINDNIPHFFRKNGETQGVVIYNDLFEAEKSGWYTKTKNDDLFPDEIKTALLAPMNAWDGQKEDMIGILYITSRNSEVFSAKHVDCVLFVADMLASAVSGAITTALNCKCFDNNKNKVEKEEDSTHV